MAWQCELVDMKRVEEKWDKHEPIPIGWMWFSPEDIDFCSSYYVEHNMDLRLPLYIQLPNDVFLLDGNSTGSGNGWQVIGHPPLITMSPSINSNPGSKRGYHGFLQNGVLTDDLEGRQYEK